MIDARRSRLPARLAGAAPVLVGMTLRLAWVLATAGPPGGPVLADPVVYYAIAENARHGAWLTDFLGAPTSFLSVGYPALVNIVRLGSVGIVGTWGAAMIINLVSSVALIIGAQRLARWMAVEIGPRANPQRAGAAAAWTMALHPDGIAATGLMMTELVGVAALAWTLLLTIRIFGGDLRKRTTIGAGALLGVSLWLRSSWMLLGLLLPALVVWRLWRAATTIPRRQTVRAAGVFVASLAALVAPLAWNNTVRVGAGPGLTSATWINICDGAGTDTGEFVDRDVCAAPFDFLPPPGWEADSARVARQQALSDIKADPVRWVGNIPNRFVHAFDLGGWGITVSHEWSQHFSYSAPAKLAFRLSEVGFVVTVLLGGYGVALIIRRRQILWYPVVLFVGTMSGVLASFGQTRYGWPIIACLAIPCAGLAIDDLLTRSRRRSDAAADRLRPTDPTRALLSRDVSLGRRCS